MRILVGMMHPKHVYMFKNFIHAMQSKGHKVEIVAIEKDVTVALLKKFGLPFKIIGKNPSTISGKILSLPQWTYQTFKIARRFKPDIFIGQAFPHFAYTSKLLNKPYIIFEDTESAQVVQSITFPFASNIITPSCYRKDLGNKHIKFDGYYELAYLHPNYFTPNVAVLKELGISPGDIFIVVRFVSWQAIHDIGHHGIRDKIGFVKSLEPYCRVLITSEETLPKELEKFRITISPNKLHDLLYYASVYIGEGGTTASEAAILGTPSIFISSLTGTLGNFVELETKYQILYSFENAKNAFCKAIELLQQSNIKEEWETKRMRLINDNVDITKIMIWFVEKYPENKAFLKNNPNIHNFSFEDT